MPEVHVPSDNALTEDDKLERIEELRKKIEGKFSDKYCREFNATRQVAGTCYWSTEYPKYCATLNSFQDRKKKTFHASTSFERNFGASLTFTRK